MLNYFHATGGTSFASNGSTFKEGGAVGGVAGNPRPLTHTSYLSKTGYQEFSGMGKGDEWFYDNSMIGSTSHLAAPNSGNSGAIITYAAMPTQKNLIKGIIASYSGTPTAGELTVTNAGVVVSRVALATAGPHNISYGDGLKTNNNEAMVITLSAGGSGITGRVETIGYRAVA